MKMQSTVRILIMALAFVSAPLAVQAQGDLREGIIEFTELIAKQPGNADLYLSRGDLYRSSQEWDRAQADYDYAHRLNPKLEVVDFLRGRLFVEANWPVSGKVSLDKFLAKQSNHVEALVTRARASAQLEDRLAASQDYTRAIQLSPASPVELYLERARAISGKGGEFANEALPGLDEAIQKFGPLVTLELAAIEIQVAQKQYDGALSRIDAIAARSPRKETWLARKGDILRDAGRRDEARASYQAALKAMESLPATRRNVPATVDLQRRIQQQLENF
jgi:tetratricopeptide (TPR) repeat protein